MHVMWLCNARRRSELMAQVTTHYPLSNEKALFNMESINGVHTTLPWREHCFELMRLLFEQIPRCETREKHYGESLLTGEGS